MRVWKTQRSLPYLLELLGHLGRGIRGRCGIAGFGGMGLDSGALSFAMVFEMCVVKLDS